MLAPATVLAAKVGFLKISALRRAQFLAVHLSKAGNESPSSQECGHVRVFAFRRFHAFRQKRFAPTPQLPIMKNRTTHPIQAHLIRGASYLVLLLAVCTIPLALAQRNATKQSVAEFGSALSTPVSSRTLTFEERVSYQRAIEEVYWGHRIWPKERP